MDSARKANVLISDLYEGGDGKELLKRAGSIVASGVRMIVLLAVSDDGAPAYDHGNAAALGCPVYACTPRQFRPDGRSDRRTRREALGREARRRHQPPRVIWRGATSTH